MSETETKLCGGAEAGQEDVFQVDERRLEGAVQEGRDQGSCGDLCVLTKKKLKFTCEDVGRATGEGRKDIERVELDWEEPLA